MRFLLTTLVWSTALSVVQSVALAQNTTHKIANLGNVTYQSDINLDVGVTSFLGIRYAAPPTGELLFSSY